MNENKLLFTVGNILTMIFVFLTGRATANNDIPLLVLALYTAVIAMATYFFLSITVNAAYRQGEREFCESFIEEVNKRDAQKELAEQPDNDSSG